LKCIPLFAQGIVEELEEEKSINGVQAIVLEVGELSAIVPDFMIDHFPIVVADKPLFKDTKLDFVVIPGRGICGGCGKPCEVEKTRVSAHVAAARKKPCFRTGV